MEPVLRPLARRCRQALAFLLLTAASISCAQQWSASEQRLYDEQERLARAGRLKEAAVVAEKLVAMAEKSRPADDPGIAAGMLTLAQLLTALDEQPRAIPMMERAIQIAEAVTGRDSPDCAALMVNLAIIHGTVENYGAAEELLERALSIEEKAMGKSSTEAGMTLATLGAVCMALGDFVKAEAIFRRAAGIFAKNPPDKVSVHIGLLGNLAGVYHELGEHRRALEPMRAALKGALDHEQRNQMPDLLNTFANILMGLDDPAEAETMLRDAIERIESRPGDQTTSLIQPLSNLAPCLAAQGKPKEAEALFRKVVRMVAGMPRQERALAHHQANLALFLAGEGQIEEATALATASAQADPQFWQRMLAFTSESQRQAVRETLHPCDLPATLGNGPLLAAALLWSKGAILESLLEDGRLRAALSTDPEIKRLNDEASALKFRLRQAELSTRTRTDQELSAWQDELGDLEQQLARKVRGVGTARQSITVTVQQIRDALPVDTVLVDFTRYSHALSRNKTESRYAAAVVSRQQPPVFVPLGKAEALDGLIDNHRLLASKPLAEGESSAARDAALEKAARALHGALAAIPEACPPGTRGLILCPDGQIHFIAFAALVTPDGGLWSEQFSFWQVGAARDLVRPAHTRKDQPSPQIVLVGDPDYRATFKPMSAPPSPGAGGQHLAANLRNGLSKQIEGIQLEPLPGTATEVARLRQRFDENGWKTLLLAGKDAEEAELRSIISPTILHLATHGLFVDRLEAGRPAVHDTDAARPRSRANDPMLRSWVALAGAQTTLDAWRRGSVPSLERDGILTAAEAAQLPLEGSRLVTLSACETALGDAKSGEGVFGLKRGFAVAGAESLVLTLWQISDDDTVAIMDAFYQRVLAGENPAPALATVQTESLGRLRREKGLFHAVNRAAPFVMVGSSRLPSTPESE